jgi:uncharacterized protein YcaQ
MKSDSLSLAEARRLALVAQGFAGKPRRENGTWSTIEKTIDRLHLLQIDSVNVLVRSHYLPLFSRIGNYDIEMLDKRTLKPKRRHCFECWAHEASLVPMSLHPLMRWRMDRARQGNGIYSSMDTFGREQAAYLRDTLRHIETNGPVRASEVPGGGKAQGGWWGWSKGKMALETLFDQGLITARERQGFERVYDLTERVIPNEVLNLPTPSEKDVFRRLLVMAAQALGVGTEFDLRDYFRLPVADTKSALAEAVEEGLLAEVKVEGWNRPAYVAADAVIPRKAGGRALLSPFDPIVWYRERTERLFDFHYRIELYTPDHKRKYGYYVLPFLMGDKLPARLCLKSDRAEGVLRVNTANAEPGTDQEEVARALTEELRLMASWLGLERVSVARKGNLAKALGKALKQAGDTSL